MVEPPTLICLGFEWEISRRRQPERPGRCRYRRSGAADGNRRCRCCEWAANGSSAQPSISTTPCRTGFAGSILDLDPDTEYEVRSHHERSRRRHRTGVQTAKVRTRGEPKAAAGGRTLHVYPPD